MQKYKEINGNDYVKDSRTTINETMRSIQSMNSGTVFPTTNLFEGMKCYRTDLKKTYTLTDVENNTWVEDAHAELADEATHAASAMRLQTPRALNLSGAVTADAANFDGTADATINVKTLDATKLKGTAPVSTTGNAATASKLATPRTISLTGKAAGSTTFDGSANAAINVTSVNADTATTADNSNKLGGYSLNTTDGAKYGSIPLVKSNGVIELGQGINWHATNNSTEDFTSTWTANTNGSVTVGDINGILNGTATNANHASNADKANTLSSDMASEQSMIARPVWLSWEGDNTRQVVSPNLTYTCGTKTLTAANFKGHLAGNADSATNADSASLISPFEIGTANTFRNVWFSDSDTSNKACYNPNIQYNPATNVLKVGTVQGNLAGNAASATNATTATKVDCGYQGSFIINKPGYNDYSPTVGGPHANVTIDSWFGVSFTSQCGGSVPKGKTAVGIDCREGIVRANRFEGTLNGNASSATHASNADSATNADTVDGYHASDIINRISAANTGGIVAASLTENGYVKFANGLILQWGKKKGNAIKDDDKWYNCAFPISFSAVPTVIDGHNSDNINNITNTGFDMLITWKHTGRYIAIGI